ncbi:MAG TPA: T9SS type A sorting domain-containing protein, partial [Bacteroidia bacterium]|nr:T9SS type A sorting domain-containing protein [Bacteroidia bacterium]
KIGITDHDVFVSSNLFNYSTQQFDQAMVVQIGKAEGYNGATLNTKVWSGLANSPFSVVPCSEGQGNAQGPAIWLVATGSGNSVELYQITNDVTSAPSMNHWSVTMPSYSPAGNSAQQGTTQALQITNPRCLSGFYLNGIIHFVFNTKDNSSANTAINYNRLNTSTKTVSNKLFTIPNIDCGYPSVASYTADGVTNDQSVMIGFCQASSSMYPAISVVSCDNSMNFGTPLKVKTSASYISGGGTNRWGDYSGICRRHSSPQACCWMAGSFADANHLWQGYVAQIYDPSFATGIAREHPEDPDFNAFPNPAVDFFSVDFTLKQASSTLSITLYDLGGKLVKELYTGYCREGQNTLSFNRASLTAGTYLLVLRGGSERLMQKKLILSN